MGGVRVSWARELDASEWGEKVRQESGAREWDESEWGERVGCVGRERVGCERVGCE